MGVASAPVAVVARQSWEMVAERFVVYLSTERGWASATVSSYLS